MAAMASEAVKMAVRGKYGNWKRQWPHRRGRRSTESRREGTFTNTVQGGASAWIVELGLLWFWLPKCSPGLMGFGRIG